MRAANHVPRRKLIADRGHHFAGLVWTCTVVALRKQLAAAEAARNTALTLIAMSGLTSGSESEANCAVRGLAMSARLCWHERPEAHNEGREPIKRKVTRLESPPSMVRRELHCDTCGI